MILVVLKLFAVFTRANMIHFHPQPRSSAVDADEFAFAVVAHVLIPTCIRRVYAHLNWPAEVRQPYFLHCHDREAGTGTSWGQTQDSPIFDRSKTGVSFPSLLLPLMHQDLQTRWERDLVVQIRIVLRRAHTSSGEP